MRRRGSRLGLGLVALLTGLIFREWSKALVAGGAAMVLMPIGVALALSLGLCGGLGGVTGPLTMGIAYDLTQSFSWGFIVMAGGMLVSVALLWMNLAVQRMERGAMEPALSDMARSLAGESGRCE